MTLAVTVEPVGEVAPAVRYRWDAETDILSVALAGAGAEAGEARSVELGGADGSWLVLDVDRDRLAGLEVAVWPELRTRTRLAPPADIVDGRLLLPAPPGAPGGPPDREVELSAESDEAEEVIYFRVGTSRRARTVRVGLDLLVDLDTRQRIAGLWLLNVPPFPSTRPAP